MNKSLLPLVGLGVVAIPALFFWLVHHPGPVLERLEPEKGSPGTPVILYGRNFGELGKDSHIAFSSATVPRSDITAWTENEIAFSIPQEAQSGPLTLTTSRGQTKGLFWVNATELPVPLSGSVDTGTLLQVIEPVTAIISDLVTLRGSGFGETPGEVLFAWGPLGPGTLEGGLDPWVRASKDEVEFWSNGEIRVRIPTGVTSGNVIVVGPRGPSNGAFLEIDSRIGTQTFSTRRRLVLSRRAEISVRSGLNQGHLRLWVPLGILDLAQRSVQVLRQPSSPSVASQLGIPAWDFTDLRPGSHYRDWEYILPVFSIQANIRGERVPELVPFPALEKYLVANAKVPWKSESFRNVSLNVGGWPGPGRTPWDRARGLYNWLATEFRWAEPAAPDLETALLRGRGSVEQGCLVLIGLLRASRIPARLVSGYLVAGLELLVPHFWVEFYLTGVGWVSADPYLGSGNAPPEFFLAPEPLQFYMGNLDNRRLTLGKEGLVDQKPMNGSRLRTMTIPQALHPFHEEVVGSLEQYEVLWHSLRVTGIF